VTVKVRQHTQSRSMAKIPKFCWLIAVVLLLSTVINYTARLTLSVVIGEVLKGNFR
jgi:cell division septal protein FtsQ